MLSGAEEIAQLRALTGLAKDQVWFSVLEWGFTTALKCSSRESNTFFCLCKLLDECGAHKLI